MSDGTGDGDKGRTNRQQNRGDARERVRQAQLKQKQAERKRKQIVIGGVVVAVLAVAAVIGIAVSHSKSNSDKAKRDAFGGTMPFAAPPGVSAASPSTSDPGGIVRGDAAAKVTLQIWEDARCPYCKLAEAQLGDVITEYVTANKIKAEYHEVDLIDRIGGGQGSLVGGNAIACAQAVGTTQFVAFHQLVFTNQPDEKTDTYGTPANLITLAEKVPNLATDAFKACANNGTYAKWVTSNYDALSKLLGGSVGTPDFYIDGTPFTITTADAATQQANLKAALDAEIAKKA